MCSLPPPTALAPAQGRAGGPLRVRDRLGPDGAGAPLLRRPGSSCAPPGVHKGPFSAPSLLAGWGSQKLLSAPLPVMHPSQLNVAFPELSGNVRGLTRRLCLETTQNLHGKSRPRSVPAWRPRSFPGFRSGDFHSQVSGAKLSGAPVAC